MIAIKIGLTVAILGFVVLYTRLDVEEPDRIGRTAAWAFLGGLAGAAIGVVWEFLP